VRKISLPPGFDPRPTDPKFSPFKFAALHEEDAGSEDVSVNLGAEVGTSVSVFGRFGVESGHGIARLRVFLVIAPEIPGEPNDYFLLLSGIGHASR